MTMMPDPDNEPGLPELVKLYIRQVAIGFALSAVFVALLLGFNIANLRSLILATQGGYIAGFLLFFFNGLVFAGVQFAISIMRMGDDDDHGPRGGHRQRVSRGVPQLIPIRVEAR
ncbi:MAG: hypothetical protein ACK4GT_09275 [Pararhodobacter sp.]